MVPLPHQRGAGDGNIGSDASIHGAPTMRGFGVPRNQAPPQQETGCMVKGGKSDRTGVKQRKCPTIVTCEAARESVISRSYPPGNAVAKTGLKTKKTKKYFIQGNLGENEKKVPQNSPSLASSSPLSTHVTFLQGYIEPGCGLRAISETSLVRVDNGGNVPQNSAS